MIIRVSKMELLEALAAMNDDSVVLEIEAPIPPTVGQYPENALVSVGDPDNMEDVYGVASASCVYDRWSAFHERCPPDVIGRADASNLIDHRSSASLVATARGMSGFGSIKIDAFASVDDEDRGGVVLRIRMTDRGDGFEPFARNIPGGVEIHMAGDAEGEGMMVAMREVLSEWKWRSADESTDQDDAPVR